MTPEVSRQEARENGSHKYFTGRPCKLGHISERYTMNAVCIACHRIWKQPKEYAKQYMKDWRCSNAQQFLFTSTRTRARRQNQRFNLTIDDFLIPPTCPVLGIPLNGLRGKRTNNTPSIDKLVPELGYIKGNVRVISWRANRLKSNASLSELELLVRYMREHNENKTKTL